MRGMISINIRYPNGEEETRALKNLVLDVGRERIVDAFINGTVLKNFGEIHLGRYAVDGTPTTPPTAGNDDTEMASDDPSECLDIVEQSIVNSGLTIKNISESISVTGDPLEFNELALYQGGQGDTLYIFSRVVLEDLEIIPEDAQFTINWLITF
ncbi:MAG: hypothetical protein SVK08_01650 [Halobacteriota archaeon]|nr:hypothetical protein [Halobacteriota archaeon]